MISSKIILKMIYMFLLYAGVDIENIDDDVHCQFIQLADAINIEAESKDETLRLVTIAYHESKFNFEGKEKIVSLKGACGVFQQLPKYSLPLKDKKTCSDLMDSYESTESAVLMIRLIRKLWGSLEKGSICHYFAGNECTVENGGFRYAKKHEKLMKKAKWFLRKAKKSDEIDGLIDRKKDSCLGC